MGGGQDGGGAGEERQGGRFGFVRGHKKPKKLSNAQLANEVPAP